MLQSNERLHWYMKINSGFRALPLETQGYQPSSEFTALFVTY